MQHYRDVQPSPTARRGIAEFPKQIRAARPLLERLARDVPGRLGSKPALFVWGMKDPAFALARYLSQLQDAFPDNVLIRLPAGEPFHSGGRTRRHRGSDPESIPVMSGLRGGLAERDLRSWTPHREQHLRRPWATAANALAVLTPELAVNVDAYDVSDHRRTDDRR